MSRFKKFAHSLASGYVLLGANVVFSLVSIPLALSYLSSPEFGLWVLISQLANYLALIDLGMSSATSRALFDVKDDQKSCAYGSMIVTSLLTSAFQGMLVLLLGFAISSVFADVLRIPPELQSEFIRVMRWQSLVTAASFPLRMFTHLLVAQHRWEIPNYAQTFGFLLNFCSLWILLEAEWRLESLVVANAVALAVSSAVTAAACYLMRVFPPSGKWGRPNRRYFFDLLAYGKDVFLVIVGVQLVMASQTVIVTRAMGLEAATVWSVCTKIYTLMSQMVWRIYDFSGSMLTEMIVRGERERLKTRFQSLVALTGSISTLAAASFAVLNEPFVMIWTGGRVHWSNWNNCLLALWLIIVSVLRCHTGNVMLTRQFGFLRYIYFIEGIIFCVVADMVTVRWGFPAMLAVSIACSVAFSGFYGVWRSTQYFNLTFREVLFVWLAPSGRTAIRLVLLSGAVFVAVRDFPASWRLVTGALVIGTLGILSLARHGVPAEVGRELIQRAPEKHKGILKRLLQA